MNDILKEVDCLVELIKCSDDYKRYLLLKDALHNNPEVMNLINEIKRLQKIIVKKKSKKENIIEEENQIETNLRILEDIPIYVEFNYLQKDLNTLFQEIKQNFEDCINRITN